MIKKILKFSIIILLILIGLTEVFFRIYYKEELKDQAVPTIFQPDSAIGYRHIPLSEGFISKPGIRKKYIRINSYGLYNPEIEKEKKNGPLRIAIVGASFATGIYMDGEKNYIVQLQELLNSSRRHVEVINFSTDGLGRGLSNLKLIESEFLNYQPDIIFLEMSFPLSIGVMYRDTYKGYLLTYKSDSTKRLAKSMVDQLEYMKIFRKIYDFSYIYRALCRVEINNNFTKSPNTNLKRVYRDKISRGDEMEEYYLSTAKTIELIMGTNETVKKNGSKLIILSYYSEKNNLAQYFNEHGITSLFLNLKFDRKNISYPDSHINESGHTMIANALFDSLTANNFFLPQ